MKGLERACRDQIEHCINVMSYFGDENRTVDDWKCGFDVDDEILMETMCSTCEKGFRP
jgi:hypothetical protein